MPDSYIAQPDFSIITVNYNNAELLINVLQRTISALDALRYEIIVVENGSTDDSFRTLVQHFHAHPYIRVIASGRNGGFGSGCNTGAKYAKAPILWFLNSDAWVSSKAGLEQALELTRQESTGVVGTSVLLNDSTIAPQGGSDMSFSYFFVSSFRPGALFRRFPSFLRRALLFFLAHLPGNMGRYARSFDHHEAKNAYLSRGVGGASFLVRANLYRTLEGFDEGFFLYDEDGDLCLRCIQLEKLNWIVPSLVANTYPSATTSKVPSLRLKLIKRKSRMRLIEKHFSGIRRRILLITTSITWRLL